MLLLTLLVSVYDSPDRSGSIVGCCCWRKEQLTMVPTGHEADGYESIGVSGCGKKAQYLLFRGTWLKDSETSHGP